MVKKISILLTFMFVTPAGAQLEIDFLDGWQYTGSAHISIEGWIAIDGSFSATPVVMNTSLYDVERGGVHNQTRLIWKTPVNDGITPPHTEHIVFDADGSLHAWGRQEPVLNSSYLIEGGHFELEAAGSLIGGLIGQTRCVEDLVSKQSYVFLQMYHCVESGQQVIRLKIETNNDPLLRGSSINWYSVGWAGQCSQARLCPHGDRYIVDEWNAGNHAHVYRENLEIRSVKAEQVFAELSYVESLILAGNIHTLEGTGSLRLPLASNADPGCGSCFNPENRTLWVTGNITLSNIRPTADGRLTATLSGDFESARLDEEFIDPALLSGGKNAVAAAAVVGIGIVLWKLAVATLYHRVSPGQVMENPRRQQIVAYVKENPGTTFRELSRGTGLAAGTLRHHLNILNRTKVTVEHTHKSTVRVFPNHGKYDTTWDRVVLLREPELKALHDFINEHPGCMQKDILERFDWSRSTIQHRLSRLEEGGVVQAKAVGRRRLYEVVVPPRSPYEKMHLALARDAPI